MTEPSLGARNAFCAVVPNGQYSDVALDLIRGTMRRCLVSMFIYDVKRAGHPALLTLTEALSDARWRGVDVRIVIGGSRSTYELAAAAATARAVLNDVGVPVRWLSAKPQRGSHAKLLIGDDVVLVGSHNWSAGAFSTFQVQDSVAVSSAALAGAIQEYYFERQWTDSKS